LSIVKYSSTNKTLVMPETLDTSVANKLLSALLSVYYTIY